MITKKTEYAIRALWELHQADGVQTTAGTIAQRQGIPPKYLPQIISELSRVGLVVSSRGFGGGLRLSRPAEEITVLEVIEAIQGKLNLFECVVGETDCQHHHSCSLRTLYCEAQRAMEDVFQRARLSDLSFGPARKPTVKNHGD